MNRYVFCIRICKNKNNPGKEKIRVRKTKNRTNGFSVWIQKNKNWKKDRTVVPCSNPKKLNSNSVEKRNQKNSKTLIYLF
jgi:hypothetical protein